MSDQTLVVLNEGGGAKASVGIRIEREVNGIAMGVLSDEWRKRHKGEHLSM